MQGRQRPPQVPRRAHKTIRSVVYLCAPHNWGEPILPEILHTPVKRGKVISPLDWCKAGNAHRRCLGERTRPYGVWSICAHPITGVNPYSRRYCLHQSRGERLFPLDLTGATQATPTTEWWSICAHPITGVNPYSRSVVPSLVQPTPPQVQTHTIRSVVYTAGDTSQEGKGYFPSDWCKATTPTAGASESAQDHTECGLSVRTP